MRNQTAINYGMGLKIIHPKKKLAGVGGKIYQKVKLLIEVVFGTKGTSLLVKSRNISPCGCIRIGRLTASYQ